MGDANLAGVRARMFAAFLLLFAQFLFAMLGVVNTFPAERAVCLREVQDRWYTPSAFYIAKVVMDTLMQSSFPVLTTLLGYWTIGFNSETAERPLIFYLICALASNVGAAMGFIVSAAVPSTNLALSIAPGLLMPQLLLCGLFIDVDLLPQPFRALSFLMAARYMVQGSMNNEFNCAPVRACTTDWHLKTGSMCDSSPCSFCCTDKEVASSGGVCPVVTCEDALSLLRLDGDNIWPSGETSGETAMFNMFALSILLLFFRIFGLSALNISFKVAARSS